uniref:Sushi domain-containing protein n=1 Tax=Steinernema glaseri TaxID=37863 RepID=A0A1I8AL43_9BILA
MPTALGRRRSQMIRPTCCIVTPCKRDPMLAVNETIRRGRLVTPMRCRDGWFNVTAGGQTHCYRTIPVSVYNVSRVVSACVKSYGTVQATGVSIYEIVPFCKKIYPFSEAASIHSAEENEALKRSLQLRVETEKKNAKRKFVSFLCKDIAPFDTSVQDVNGVTVSGSRSVHNPKHCLFTVFDFSTLLCIVPMPIRLCTSLPLISIVNTFSIRAQRQKQQTNSLWLICAKRMSQQHLNQVLGWTNCREEQIIVMSPDVIDHDPAQEHFHLTLETLSGRSIAPEGPSSRERSVPGVRGQCGRTDCAQLVHPNKQWLRREAKPVGSQKIAPP